MSRRNQTLFSGNALSHIIILNEILTKQANESALSQPDRVGFRCRLQVSINKPYALHRIQYTNAHMTQRIRSKAPVQMNSLPKR